MGDIFHLKIVIHNLNETFRFCPEDTVFKTIFQLCHLIFSLENIRLLTFPAILGYDY